MLVAGGQLIAVHEIDCSFFSGNHQRVRMASGLIRQQKHATRTQVLIVAVEANVVKRNKIIQHVDLAATEGELEHAVAQFRG